LKNSHLLFVLTALLAMLPRPAAAQQTFTVNNALGQQWPWELTYRDFDAGTFRENQSLVARIGEQTFPAQLEQIDADGERADRVWFMARIQGENREPDSRGRVRRESAPREIDITIAPGDPDPALQIQEQDNHWLIDAGVYEFRLRKGLSFDEPRPLNEVSHWIGGTRAEGQEDWDGRAWWDGNAPVSRVEVEWLQRGPVMAEARITYHFADVQTDENTEAMPLANGKQTYRWDNPDQPPREEVPTLPAAYEAQVRFVVGDVWIDVNERYHLPRDGSLEPWGIHQYWLHFGEPPEQLTQGPAADVIGLPADSHMDVSRVSWVRWFEYDAFGGNVEQQTVEARPRDAQRGRPFALLRPRWNQGGGGAQDMILHGEGGQSPAAGIVAAFASKWVGPYPATIAGYAYDGERGQFRFPCIDGERSGMHYGQRAYGLIVGPRNQVGHLNHLVRRHTDWTLAAQMNHYILEWDRNPDLAGPNILVTRDQMETLRRDAQRADSPVATRLQQQADRLGEMSEQLEDLHTQLADVEERRGEASGDARDALDDERNQLRREIRDIDRRMDSHENRLARHLLGEQVDRGSMPDAGLWLQRRYQDDFLNPTSRPTRQIPDLQLVDLFADGQPLGGPQQAALGYIFTDLDQWPGWHQGWSPGNPNFHTDKYMNAAFVAATMRDHPHSDRWLQFAQDNFDDDQSRVIAGPDGVGYECPGYSGYSMYLQMKTARIFVNADIGNPLADNPLVLASGRWHRHLLTPVDPRLQHRHEAPIGDTHRWTSGLGDGFGILAGFLEEQNPEGAAEMFGVYQYLQNTLPNPKADLIRDLAQLPNDIEPMDMADMDWTSDTWHGFGAIMRDGFGTPGESHVTIKAGPLRGHYHNDENSYHLYLQGQPVSLDYNCSYDPRGDHAALHNSMTFGNAGTVRHNERGQNVEAMEQIGATAWPAAFATTDVADVVVTERRSGNLGMSPVDPGDHEFGRDYPDRRVDTPIIHRRFTTLVKHADGSPMPDYLVVRDETQSTEPQQVNIHLLAHEATPQGEPSADGSMTILAPGQLDRDILVHVASADSPELTVRQWHYYDEWLQHPGEVARREGESLADWRSRMQRLMDQNNVDSLPLPDWAPSHGNPDGSGEWFAQIRATDGGALQVPPFWDGAWRYGEQQQWLRLQTAPGTPVLWLIYPRVEGMREPTFETLADGTGVRITAGDAVDEIYLATDPVDGTAGQAVLIRNGETTVLLGPDDAPPMGEVPQRPLAEPG
jgi:hypothetical protein